MSKKMGPNSPMESERSKQKGASTSAAAATLSMASMLSVVSGAFSSQRAASTITDSEDDYQSQEPNGSENGEQDENPWSEANLSKSNVRSPIKDKPKPIFESYRDGAMRDEIEIEIQTKNGKKFTGSITPLEIKYNIYIDALKFPDHENFDGARVGFKGKLIATIKLITPINIDELSDTEFFEFTRTTSIRGKKTDEVIGCKIKGVRWQPNTVSAFENPKPDDDRTIVKIEGCDYQVPEEQILTWLSHYGEIKSELEEDLFKDSNETQGNNRTGNYSIMMVLEHKIPQLIPMNGRRVKIYHKGIEKLCTKCFGKHRKSDCRSENKVNWLDYVRNFMVLNEFIPIELFGRWNDLVKTVSDHNNTIKKSDEYQEEAPIVSEKQKEMVNDKPSKNKNIPDQSTSSTTVQESRSIEAPREEDFGIPQTEKEYEAMVERMSTCGFNRADLDKILETKKTAFNKATREYRNQERKQQLENIKSTRKTRKESLTKQSK